MGRRAVLARLWWTYCLSPGPGRPARKRTKPSIFDRRDHHDAGRISSRDHAQQHRLPGANPQSNPDGKLLSSGFKKRFKPQRSYGCFNHNWRPQGPTITFPAKKKPSLLSAKASRAQRAKTSRTCEFEADTRRPTEGAKKEGRKPRYRDRRAVPVAEPASAKFWQTQHFNFRVSLSQLHRVVGPMPSCAEPPLAEKRYYGIRPNSASAKR